MTSPTDPTNPYQQGTPGAQGPEPTFNQVPPEGASPYQQQAPGYQQPTAGYQQPAPSYAANGPVTEEHLNTVKLNLWLSVFFSWLPALIFWLTQKDVPANVKDIHRENLNFQILRTIVAIITPIPFVGWVLGGIAGIVLFVFAIIAAVKAPEEVAQGGVYKYPFNLQIIK